MNIRTALVATTVTVAGLGLAQAAQPIAEQEMGLSKSSVVDVPVPDAFDYVAVPGTLPRYFADAPPMIPHAIGAYTPITAQNNVCLGCHKQPDKAGEKTAGQPTPMPTSHYTDLRNAPDTATKEVDAARHVCTQCHAPQADAKPLVENTFGNP